LLQQKLGDYQAIIIDQFVNENKYYEYLHNEKVIIKDTARYGLIPYTECFKKSFATLKAYRNFYRNYRFFLMGIR
jgi:ribonuclease HIII